MKSLVYGLIDPDTREMRYVGATTVGMHRPRSHLNPKVYDGQGPHRNWHIYRWVRSVVARNMKPEVVVIEYATEGHDVYGLEVGWIEYFRGIGCRLTNATNGGEGTPGIKFTAEHRARISSALRDYYASPHPQHRIGTRRPHSKETRMKMSAAAKGRHMSDETKSRLRMKAIAQRAHEREKEV